jgi:2-polyprenyl-3-methyl-5-hydroxy-6-metoxy-1,4-benzoquinol methylase
MDKDSDKVATFYDSIASDYSMQYEMEDTLTKEKYPQNYYRLQGLAKRFEEIEVKSVYEVGTGEGTPLAVLGKKGFLVAGCDISEKMVERTKAHLQNVSLDPERVQFGDIEKFETISNQLDLGPFDALFAFGVMPHVADDDIVFENYKKLIKSNGRVFIEFRNKLFSLFTFNRYTRDFIVDDLLAEFSPKVKDLVAKDLENRVEMQLPEKRPPSQAGGISYDEIPAKYHNPFEVEDFFKKHGFSDIQFHWYHYHAAPPLLEPENRDLFWKEASKMETFDNSWRGFFLCSAFVIEAQLEC